MDANVIEPGRLADPAPRLLQVLQMRSFLPPGDHKRVAIELRQVCKNLDGLAATKKWDFLPLFESGSHNVCRSKST